MLTLDVGTLILTKSVKRFEIKGVKPSFHNDGNTSIKVLSITIAPGEIYSLNLGDNFVKTTLTVEFVPSATPANDINKLVIHYGIPC